MLNNRVRYTAKVNYQLIKSIPKFNYYACTLVCLKTNCLVIYAKERRKIA